MRKLIALKIVGLLFVTVTACASQAQQLTPEERQTITQLQGELGRVESEIESAEEDNRTYSGGLIKTLITLRLEILKTNHALIQQRIHALESGAEIDITVIGSEPDPELAANLLVEIEDQRTKITEAEQEAARYSGGLVQAMALSAVATQRNTLAMLEQKYFSAEYGLAAPMPTASPEAGVAGGATPVAPPSNPAADCLKIEDFDSSVLDRNNSFVELAWRVERDELMRTAVSRCRRTSASTTATTSSLTLTMRLFLFRRMGQVLLAAQCSLTHPRRRSACLSREQVCLCVSSSWHEIRRGSRHRRRRGMAARTVLTPLYVKTLV